MEHKGDWSSEIKTDSEIGAESMILCLKRLHWDRDIEVGTEKMFWQRQSDWDRQ